MNYQRIITTLFKEPWLVTQESHDSMVDIVKSDAMREGKDICGAAVDVPGMVIEDGIAIIPVAGVMARSLNGWGVGAGMVDMEDITKELQEAEENPDVFAILLDIDSPGGTVNGTPELGESVMRVEKPTFSFTSGMACSAAQWLAAAADYSAATRSAMVGSIGVICTHFSYAEHMKQMGIKPTVLTAGKSKGNGNPYEPLSDEAKKEIQERVTSMHAEFKSHIRMVRGDIDDDYMQGQVLSSMMALEAGLIDEIVSSKAELLEKIRAEL